MRNLLAAGLLLLAGAAPLFAADTNAPKRDIILLTFAGQVDVAPAGTTAFAPGKTNQILQLGDHLRSGKSSRATLRLSDLSVLRVYELTTLEIKPPAKPKANDVIDIKSAPLIFSIATSRRKRSFRRPRLPGPFAARSFSCRWRKTAPPG